ncbi:hypothetical protein [Ekhidna sp.]|uniref:hypothetical protein n=1 Tax=Ekhidna sp. TaxID=2608089 RepID=UPI003BAD337B
MQLHPLSQKEKERNIFDHFIKILNLKAENLQQPDPPDIVADIYNRKIGIEITEIYPDSIGAKRGSKRAKNELTREKILELTITEVQKKIKWPFDLIVLFQRNEISDHDVKNLPKIISEIIIEILKDVTPTEDWKKFEYFNQDQNINLNHFSILVNKHIIKHTFSPIALDWIPNLKSDIIRDAIKRKEGKLDRYKNNSDEVWLILCELGGIASSFASVSEATKEKFNSVFDRIYLFRYQYKKVIQLNC